MGSGGGCGCVTIDVEIYNLCIFKPQINTDERRYSVVYYFMSDNVVLKNLPNSKEHLEYLLSLMESFYFYPAS